MGDKNVSVALLNSLISRFRAQKDEAVAIIMLYLRNPAGIGDHPGIVDELDLQFSKAAEADEKLKILTNNFRLQQEDSEVGEDGK